MNHRIERVPETLMRTKKDFQVRHPELDEPESGVQVERKRHVIVTGNSLLQCVGVLSWQLSLIFLKACCFSEVRTKELSETVKVLLAHGPITALSCGQQ